MNLSMTPVLRALGLSLPVLLVILSLQPAHAANQPPVVNAGEDQPNARTDEPTHLFGEVTDPDTPEGEITTTWRQVSGPQQLQIEDPNATLVTIVFTTPGVYVFEFRASDGQLTTSDSLTVTVRTPLPFTVLFPNNNAPVEIGKPFTIRWQMDPSDPCVVSYSLDGGATFVLLSDQGSVRDSFVWTFPVSYKDSARQGIIEVQKYQEEPTCQGTFVLVDPGAHAVVPVTPGPGIVSPSGAADTGCGCGAGTGLAFFPPVAFKIASLRQRRKIRRSSRR